MPAISPIIELIRQTWHALKLFYEESRLDAQLNQYKDPDFFFAGLQDPYLELETRNRLVLAEYQVEREQLLRLKRWESVESLWRRTKELMDANLRRTEDELKARPANLYQIAVLSSGLAKVAGETENELAKLSHRIDEAIKMVEQTERGLRLQLGKCETELAAAQKKVQELANAVEALEKDFTAKLDSAVQGVEQRMASRYERLQQSVADLKSSFEAELATLKTDLVQNLQDQSLLLQQMGQRMAEMRRWFLIAVVAVAVWLMLLTVATILP